MSRQYWPFKSPIFPDSRRKIYQIELPAYEDCTFTSNDVVFKSFSPLHENMIIESIPIQFDVALLFNVTMQDLQSTLLDFGSDRGKKAFASLQQVRKEIAEARELNSAATHSWANSIRAGTATVVILIILMAGGCAIYHHLKKKKKQSERAAKELHQLMEMREDKADTGPKDNKPPKKSARHDKN